MRRLLAVLLVGLALAACGEEAPKGKSVANAPIGATKDVVPQGKGFDFYVLSLSWSPTWCADNDRDGKSRQCRKGNDYGFVVHGLWPQYDRGYPEFCPSRQPDRVPDALGGKMLDIIPSMSLVGHQWRKHGSCSGLSQADYFKVVRSARERITVPDALAHPGRNARRSADAIEAAFIADNPGLTHAGVAVTCDRGRLDEVRLCLTADLDFRACPEVDRSGCRSGELTQPSGR